MSESGPVAGSRALHGAAGELLSALLAKSSDYISVVDTRLQIVWRSSNIRELRSERFLDYVHDEDVPQVAEAFRRVLAGTGHVEVLSFRAVGLNGAAPVIESIFTNCVDDPNIGGVLVNSRDVTEQTREEDALRRSAQGLNSIIEEMPLGIAICREGRVALVNRALETLTGRPREALIGMPSPEFIAPEDRARAAALMDATVPGHRHPTQELHIARKDGGVGDTEFSSVAINFDGDPALLLFFADVTERKELRARVAFTDRMVSVGTLAAGVAHEVNNPLAFMTMNLAFIAEELERVTQRHGLDQELVDVMSALKDARTGCTRVREIVRDLRTFSRADQDARTNVDVAQVLETCLSMTRNEMRHRAQVVTELHPVPPVEANHAQLAQVLLNLLLNAAQAVHEGDAVHNQIFVGLRAEGAKVLLTVRDTGCGIPAKNLPRIFDPFFTTKPVGTATGLGLAISHNIVTKLGGSITVETVEGRGSTFTVELPAGVPQTRSSEQRTVDRRTRSSMLIVDDDESIGLSLTRALRDAHDITYVEHAQRALTLLRGGKRFDSILCDLLMPDMSGADLYDAVLAEFPEQARRMVFMTAGAFMPEAADFFHNRAHWRIEKPFTVDQVESTIAAMLSSLDKPTGA